MLTRLLLLSIEQVMQFVDLFLCGLRIGGLYDFKGVFTA